MCMEDIRIARKTLGREVDGVATVTSAQAIGSNERRTALTFSGFSTGGGSSVVLTFSTANPAVAGQGITITNFGGPFTIRIEEIGNQICKPWYCISQVGNINFAIFESWLGED